MKKLLLVAAAALLTLTACSAPAQECPVCETPTVDEAALVAEGWVKNPLENGYVLASEVVAPVELPAETVDVNATYKPSKDADAEACKVGVFAADCGAINKTNLTEYMGLDDVLYIDLRDFSDYTKKHLRNFECVPYFAYIFNAEAGTDPEKVQLFGGSVAEPVAQYEESLDLLKELFPQDKTIFLMCQSGGRVAQCMTLLSSLGWDMSKIYNVGGMGQYTDAAFDPYVVDAAECTVEAVYSFEGLTQVK